MSEKKPFPVHLFVQFNKTTGQLEFNSKASVSVKKILKIYKNDSKGYWYWRVRVNSGSFKREEVYGHKAVWMKAYGKIPNTQIRFKDGDGLNLSLENLFIKDP